jgi:3-hydroxy-9,10-secoandrosta-1,3,5(10)-triene-9,17-dione monooxygenase
MADVDVSGGTVGSRLHGNPLYATRGIGFFAMGVGAIMVGAALGALDEFERILKARKMMRALFLRCPKIRTINAGSAWQSRA